MLESTNQNTKDAMLQPLTAMMMGLGEQYQLRLDLQAAQARAAKHKQWLDENKNDGDPLEIVCRRRSLRMALQDIIDISEKIKPFNNQ